MVTEFLLHYPSAQVVRGYEVDKQIRPDAEIVFGEHRCLLELDTGQMTHRQLKFKWFRRYHKVTDMLLFVTLGAEERLQRVVENAQRVHSIGLFTTFSRLKQEPVRRRLG